MKVFIGPYKNWVGPYQIAEKLLFWLHKDDEKVLKFGEWLDNTWLRVLCEWVYSKRKRKVKIKIHDYDIWDMNTTIGHIILPMLIMIRDKKHGAPYVDNEDVPEHLRSYYADDGKVDEHHFARWDYVLDEMIFAFDYEVNDKEHQYLSQSPMDVETYYAVQKRVQRGFELFGKYYTGLWT
jgi:hypothetical protein